MAAPEVVLESARLLYCRLRREDAETHHRWINTPPILRTLPVPGPVPREMSDAILEQLLAMPAEQGVRFAIWTREPLRLIGGVGLHELHPRDQHATAVLFLGEADVWGQGYATEAARRILAYAFEDLGLRKVWMNHQGDNHRIRKLVEALGFVEVGRQRDHVRAGDGWVDWVTMELFHPDVRGGP